MFQVKTNTEDIRTFSPGCFLPTDSIINIKFISQILTMIRESWLVVDLYKYPLNSLLIFLD